jgi:hypothetical protein
MTDATRAQELDALLSHILDRPERPTWITGRNVHAEACLRTGSRPRRPRPSAAIAAAH